MKSAGYIVVVLFATLTLASAEILNKGWWKNMVFYQIYPKSFKDSDGNGVGDLKGITSKLQHFKDIGVGGIWLSPINKSPQVDNGYDISDFRDIDEIFGTLADFDDLVNQAHSLGLKVVLDLVPNHTSDKHVWFQQSVEGIEPYKDYYVWHDCTMMDDGTIIPPNNWASVFNGSGWTWDDTRQQCYYHQFYEQQPDLNYNNTAVQREMKDIITFWLDRGLDGFRIDAVPHIIEGDISKDEPTVNVPGAKPTDHVSFIHTLTKDQPGTYDIIQSWRTHVDNYAQQKNRNEVLLMTEAYTSLDNTIKYYKYGSNVPFNFKYITDASSTSSATKFQQIADTWLQAMPQNGTANWVMGNHDRNRVPTRYPGRGDQMIMLEMILPGVAVTYYGEEIGMVDYTETGHGTGDFRDGCRTPMQWNAENKAGFTTNTMTWLPVNPNYVTVNVEAQKKEPTSPLNMYRELIKLRNTDVLRKGDVTTAVLSSDVFVVARNLSSNTVALLINFNNNNNVTVNLTNVIKNAVHVRLTDTKTRMTLNTAVNLAQFSIPAKSSVILVTPNSASTIGFSVVSVLLIAIASVFQS
ncbi:alpha glucosidase 2 [Lasioglossum baleicum]|uniref:alpha glucosidase 2 n=1 Tax=Lasioglossum baleicum TaxID=434251 RepID=UPI003FCE6297